MSQFGNQFLWGTATSSHQIEGNCCDNNWWQFEKNDLVENKEKSGPATDHWHLFRQDLNLAEDLGSNAYRFSIEWSKIEPEEGVWNKQSLEWYKNLIHECEARKLKPFCTLFHFTLPRWLSEKGGLTHPNFPEYFARYTKNIKQALGSRISIWCTLNEPMTLVIGSYLGNFMPPLEFAPKKAAIANYNLLRAHLLAYQILHEPQDQKRGPWRYESTQVGIAHNMIDFVPYHSKNLFEIWLSKIAWRYYNKSWLDALVGKKQKFGILGIIPSPKQLWEARHKRLVDYIGINYYTKGILSFWRNHKPTEQQVYKIKNFFFGLSFAKHSEMASDIGWAIHPKGLYNMLSFVKNYHLPIYITENGIADSKDSIRQNYLLEHVQQVAMACNQNIPVQGYFHWSLLDNFEWIKGFSPRFGLVEVDYKNFERTARPSFYIYKEVIKHHEYSKAPNLNILNAISHKHLQATKFAS